MHKFSVYGWCAAARGCHQSGTGGQPTQTRASVHQHRAVATLGCFAAMILLSMTACVSNKPRPPLPPRPVVAPTEQSTTVPPLSLDASHITPMYTEMLAIDLPAVVMTATARNVDIMQARQAVVASQGRVESAVGAVFPAIVPTAMFNHVDGTVRATEGNLVGVGFNTFQTAVAVQWLVNPGRVLYNMVAARKRLLASEDAEHAVTLETLRRSAHQFYDLVLAQTRIAAANQGVAEADELLRISKLLVRTGTGVPADQLRAEARLAERRQDLASALNGFYNASVALSVTLHLDSATTLVPSIEQLPPIHLIREDIPILTLLDIAVTFRPDLQSVRTLAEAVTADKGATWWGAFGPQFDVSYQYGGIMGNANNVQDRGIPGNLTVNPLSSTGSFSSNPIVNGFIREGIGRGSSRRDDQTFGFSDQQRARAAIGWRISVAAFGDLKTAGAVERRAVLDAERRMDEVKAQVVTAAQASRTNAQLMTLGRQRVMSAEEALRLTEANLQAGVMTLLDVLQAQDAATQARLRYAESVVRYNQSQVDLLAALGLLDAKSLGASEEVGAGTDG